MLHQTFDINNATLVQTIEAQIIDGLAHCRSVTEIAAQIADTLEQAKPATPSASDA